MFKIKGKEVPVSKLECYLHDSTFNQLDWITTYLKAKNNVETLIYTIDHLYNVLKQHEQYLVDGKIEEDKEVLNKLDDKNASKDI